MVKTPGALGYVRGDVVIVKPDGWNWGIEELSDRFAVLHVSDRNVQFLRKYETLEMDPASEPDPDTGEPTGILRRRAFQLDIDGLPASIKSGLVGNARRASVRWNQVRSHVKEKRTGQDEGRR